MFNEQISNIVAIMFDHNAMYINKEHSKKWEETRETEIPLKDQLAHQGNDPRSWHSVQDPKAPKEHWLDPLHDHVPAISNITTNHSPIQA